jgi:hypothetical protein
MTGFLSVQLALRFDKNAATGALMMWLGVVGTFRVIVKI